jgi:hypothetical protein
VQSTIGIDAPDHARAYVAPSSALVVIHDIAAAE